MAELFSEIGHIAISYPNFDQLLDFYTSGFGLSVLRTLEPEDHSWSLTYVTTREHQYLELFPTTQSSTAQASDNYFSLAVDHSVFCRQRLANAGVCMQTAESALYVQDPGGTKVLLTERSADTLGICRIHLACRDLSAMLHFYRDQLMLPVLSANSGGTRYLLGVGVQDTIELFSAETSFVSESSSSIRHYCLLTPDIVKAARILDQHHCTLLEGGERFLTSDPARLLAELAKVDLCGSLSMGVEDPEGNWVEIMQYTAKSIQLQAKN